jgi:hypothetical protein
MYIQAGEQLKDILHNVCTLLSTENCLSVCQSHCSWSNRLDTSPRTVANTFNDSAVDRIKCFLMSFLYQQCVMCYVDFSYVFLSSLSNHPSLSILSIAWNKQIQSLVLLAIGEYPVDF